MTGADRCGNGEEDQLFAVQLLGHNLDWVSEQRTASMAVAVGGGEETARQRTTETLAVQDMGSVMGLRDELAAALGLVKTPEREESTGSASIGD